MAEVLLFHHAQGLTSGVLAFADELRAHGNVVHTPDLYDGHTFGTLDEGMAYSEETGFGTIIERGLEAAGQVPTTVVFGGFSLGVLPAQLLAQTRPGARGALLMHAAIPLGEFSDSWPAGVPGQIHVMEHDELGDVPIARDLATAAPDDIEVHFYPGDAHLFTDSSLPAYDSGATAIVIERALAFLERT